MRRYIYRELKIIICLVSMIIILAASSIICRAEEVEENVEEEKDDEILSQITDIEILEYDEEIYVGSSGKIRVKILPEGADDSQLHYESSDTSVATVNSDGEIKGISKGNATITITAGEVIKQVGINVKVKTKSINISNNYVVLKLGQGCKIEASVSPADADQVLSYKTSDSYVADVDSDGNIIANNPGTTTVIISNGQVSNSVSVIVNRNTKDNYKYGGSGDSDLNENNETFECPDVIDSSIVEYLDTEFLYNLNKSGQSIKIVGQGYSIIIDGSKIKNFNNVFYTDINMHKTNNGFEFEINKGQKLCGEILLELDGVSGKKLYLFNEEKGKYELLDVDNITCLTLTREGRYVITDKRLDTNYINLNYLLMGAAGFGIVAAAVYIFTTKRYWFW